MSNEDLQQRVDFLRGELESIRDTFLAAVAAREGRGGQCVPYFGEFASVPPSVVKQMKWWIDRFSSALDRTR